MSDIENEYNKYVKYVYYIIIVKYINGQFFPKNPKEPSDFLRSLENPSITGLFYNFNKWSIIDGNVELITIIIILNFEFIKK